jgi:16S rRNA (guanine527-N7)-methyltransferase
MLETLLRGAQQLGISLTTQQTGQFQTYYEQLVAWNEKVNLTSITDYEEVQTKHFLDSLTIVPVLSKEPWAGSEFSLIDIGTGAGFPGIPLKIVLPGTRIVLLESVGKKTAFLTYVVDTLGLSDAEIVKGRAEEVAHRTDYREKFEVAVGRALGKLATLAELTLPFCRQGGLVIAPKKGEIGAELDRAGRAMEQMGGRLKGLLETHIEGLKDHRLVVMEKVTVTPPQYPRRPGMPAKRPL